MPNFDTASILNLPEETLGRIFANLVTPGDRAAWAGTCTLFRMTQSTNIFTSPETLSTRRQAILSTYFPTESRQEGAAFLQNVCQEIISIKKNEENSLKEFEIFLKKQKETFEKTNTTLSPFSRMINVFFEKILKQLSLSDEYLNTLSLNSLYLFLVSAYNCMGQKNKYHERLFSPQKIAEAILTAYRNRKDFPFNLAITVYFRDFFIFIISPQERKDLILMEYKKKEAIISYLCRTCHSGDEPDVAAQAIQLETSSAIKADYTNRLIDKKKLTAAILENINITPLFLYECVDSEQGLKSQLSFKNPIDFLPEEDQKTFREMQNLMGGQTTSHAIHAMSPQM